MISDPRAWTCTSRFFLRLNRRCPKEAGNEQNLQVTFIYSTKGQYIRIFLNEIKLQTKDVSFYNFYFIVIILLFGICVLLVEITLTHKLHLTLSMPWTYIYTHQWIHSRGAAVSRHTRYSVHPQPRHPGSSQERCSWSWDKLQHPLPHSPLYLIR